MPRPKSGTPEGKLATERWRETMQERYGDVTEKMQEIGSIGGKASNNGGFASKKIGRDGLTGAERAKQVGAVGGAISRRKPKVQTIEQPVEQPKKSVWERIKQSA